MTTKLTPEVARRVCRATNSRMIVVPSLADAGNRFQIDVLALDCQSGNTVAGVREEGATRGEVVHALGVAEWKLRRKLGEPWPSLARFNRPLEEATSARPRRCSSRSPATSSSSLRTGGSRGRVPARHRDRSALRDRLHRPVGLVRASGQSRCGESGSRKDRSSSGIGSSRIAPRENNYYDLVTGNQEKACAVASRRVQTYPRDVLARSGLARCLSFLGQLDRAADEAREAARLAPSASTSAT